MFRIVYQFGVLLCFWVLISGSADWQHLSMGVLIAFLVAFVWRRESELIVKRVTPRWLVLSLYAVLALLYEVWIAAWQVVPVVLARQINIEPVLVRVKLHLRTQRLRALYANCITLTPGTLTVHMEGDTLLVHALTRASAEGVLNWGYQETLRRLEDR